MSDPTYGQFGSFTKATYYDPKTDRDMRMYFNLNKIFHDNADPIAQLLLMACGKRPIGEDGKVMNVHHINQEDHKKGGNFALLSDTIHDCRQLHNAPPLDRGIQLGHRNLTPAEQKTKNEKQKEFQRGFDTVSRNFIRTMFTHLVEGRLRHPAITEAVRQDFLKSREYRNAAKCVIRYQSVPKAGGIEIMALSSLPQCSEIKRTSDNKFLSATFNRTKYWLPVSGVTQDEIIDLIYSSILNATRLCIDISAFGPFYTVNLDGGITQGSDIAKTMERADLLLGAMSFGRNARTGDLFKPKQGQLPGYKNPVLEEARLLKTDPEYAAARCNYIDVYPYPTLVYNTPFSLPVDRWWDVWPKLEFPKSYFRVTWRLVMADLYGDQAYYDVPVTSVDQEAKILLRPYQALMDSVQKHGADWIESEPDLRKVNQYAKIFHVLSPARTSSNLKNITIPFHVKKSPMSFYMAVDERADFRLPLPTSTETDILGEALESAFTAAIVSNPDDLTRAAQYRSLGSCCLRQNKFDTATLHFLQAGREYVGCLQRRLSDSKPTEREYAKIGMRDCFTSVLETIYLAPSDWVFQKEEAKYPRWWIPLLDQFGQALHVVTRVLKEPQFLSMDESKSKIAAPLVVHVLLVHLAHEMLTEFEKLEDLDGIRRICGFMTRLYRGMKEKGIPVPEKDCNGDSECRWSSVERASLDLKSCLFANVDEADPFKVLEKVLQKDADRSQSFTMKQQGSSSSTASHPLAEPVGGPHSSSQRTTADGKVVDAEQIMDAYFIQGDVAASLACALVLVGDERFAATSTLADRTRLWTKAEFIAEFAFAQQNLLSVRQLVEGVMSTLTKKLYQTSVIKNKTALLSHLTEACTLLEPCRRVFPRASEALRSLVYDAMAKVHEAWFDSNTASKWKVAARAREQAAESESDDLGARWYANEWLLEDKSKKREDALECTSGWRAMVEALV